MLPQVLAKVFYSLKSLANLKEEVFEGLKQLQGFEEFGRFNESKRFERMVITTNHTIMVMAMI